MSILRMSIFTRDECPSCSCCRTAKVFLNQSWRKTSRIEYVAGYGEGEAEVVALIVVFVSVLVDGAGDSFTTVVLVSLFSPGGFVTVVSFCSHATRSVAA